MNETRRETSMPGGPVGAVTTFAALARADKLAAAGDWDAAGRQVIDHLRRNPDEPQGLAKLGEIATHLGALGQAEHFLRKAIARGLASADVRRNLASVLNQQERPEEADRLFAPLESEIDDPAVPALRAMIRAKLGRHAAARAIHDRLTQRYPHRPPYWTPPGPSHPRRARATRPAPPHP